MSRVRRGWAETWTGRRAAFAGLLFVVLLVIGGSVVGLAAASNAPQGGAAPAWFGVPEPRVGDKATYALFRYAGDREVMRPTGPGTAILAFRIEAPVRALDGRGIQHDAVPIAYANLATIQETPFSYDGMSAQHLGDIVLADFWTNQSIGHTYLNLMQRSLGSDPTRFQLLTNSTVYSPSSYGEMEDHLPACGLRNAFQGGRQSPTSVERLFDPCHFALDFEGAGHTLSIDKGTFAFARVASLGGHDDLVFVQKRHGTTTEVWFDERVPYPVLFVFKARGSSSADVVFLAEFQNGEGPAATSFPARATSAAPAIRWSPRERWGPSDGDVEHAFPLSAAFAHIMQDDGGASARGFLVANPNATVLSASYDYRAGTNGDTRVWTLRLGHRGESHTVTASMVTGDGGNSVCGVFCLEKLQRGSTRTYSVHSSGPSGGNGLPGFDNDELPAVLPTIASLEARWSAYAPGLQGEPSWGFSYVCATKKCDRPILQIQAGMRRDAGTDATPQIPSPSTTPPGRDKRADELQFDFDRADSEPVHVYHVTWVAGVNYSDGTHAGQRMSPATASTIPNSPAAFLAIPLETFAVGAGTFALLGGLVYWFWPTLRVVGWGLFSRLDRDKILDHPIRRDVLAAVGAEPGIHFSELDRRLGVGHGNLDHHLRQLMAKGLLAEVVTDGFRCLYLPGSIGAGAARGLPNLKAIGAQRVLSGLAHTPGVDASELARRLGLAQPTVHYHVRRLVQAGLVQETATARAVQLYLTPAGRDARARLGVMRPDGV